MTLAEEVTEVIEDDADIENTVNIEDIEGEDIELIKPIEPGSLEWFRANAPLPLLLQVLLEDPQHRRESGSYDNETAKSACKRQDHFWDILRKVEAMAKYYEGLDDPTAKAIVARLKPLYGGY